MGREQKRKRGERHRNACVNKIMIHEAEGKKTTTKQYQHRNMFTRTLDYNVYIILFSGEKEKRLTPMLCC